MDQEEISDKIRKAIKAKLTELGNYIDDELPDYIMVMIANKKNVEQMSTDLELFLGDNAEPFTQWLDNLLTRLQSVAKSVVKAEPKSARVAPVRSAESVVTTEKIKPVQEIKQTPVPDVAVAAQYEAPVQRVMATQQVAPADSALLTLHAQEDDEVTFDDDFDDPVERYIPSPVEVSTPAIAEVKSKSKPSNVKAEKAIPSDLLAAQRRMISTRGDSELLIPRATVQPSRRTVEPQDSGPQAVARPDSIPRHRAVSPYDRRRSPARRHSPWSPDRRHSPNRRSPSPHRAPASSRLGGRYDNRDGRSSRDYRPPREHGDRRDDHRPPRDAERRDDYRPRFQDRGGNRPYDRNSRPFRRPVWQEDTGRDSRDRSPLPTGGLVSQIGSAVPRIELLSDSSEDEYNPAKPQIGSVASIIKVSERKSSVPEALQANKKLLLRAMADVTKSLGPPPLEVVPAVAEKSPVKNRPTAPAEKRIPVKSRIGATITTMSAKERIGRLPMSGRLQRGSPELKRRKSRSRSRSRSPRRLDDYDEDELLEVLQLLQEKRRKKRGGGERPAHHSNDSQRRRASPGGKESANQSKASNSDSDVTTDKERPPSPKFVVTLDAVADMSKLLPYSKNLDDDDIDLLDNSIADASGNRTEDDVSLDLNLVSAISDETNTLSKILCRFLPNCKAGKDCLFFHPICKNYRNCRFGSACIYTHPAVSTKGGVCKYDKTCTNDSCSYIHTAKKLVNTGLVHSHLKTNPLKSAAATAPSSKTVCRFHPKCTNMDCQYLHPKPCKYGISCMMRNAGCIFTHPSLPSKTQLKWMKPAATIKETAETT